MVETFHISPACHFLQKCAVDIIAPIPHIIDPTIPKNMTGDLIKNNGGQFIEHYPSQQV
jgi:hypothetical protein